VFILDVPYRNWAPIRAWSRKYWSLRSRKWESHAALEFHSQHAQSSLPAPGKVRQKVYQIPWLAAHYEKFIGPLKARVKVVADPRPPGWLQISSLADMARQPDAAERRK